MPLTARGLLRAHRESWQVTVNNPFVRAVASGSLPIPVFDAWVVQARYVADGLFRACARVAALAPPADRPVFVATLRLIEREMGLYDRRLASLGGDSRHPVEPVSRALVSSLIELGWEPYAVGVTALWCQHRTYLEAWSRARRAPPPYRRILAGWNVAIRSDWRGRFERVVDRALAVASPAERERATAAFLGILDRKLEFWAVTL